MINSSLKKIEIPLATLRVEEICKSDVGVLYDIILFKNTRAIHINGFRQLSAQHNPPNVSYRYIETRNPD